MGIVLRDGKGIFWFGASIGIHEVNEQKEIELLVIFRGLQLCGSMGISRIQVKSDCPLMINLCKKEGLCNSRFGILVSGI